MAERTALPRKPLTVDEANRVYDVLVKFAGAAPRNRDNFVQSQTGSFHSEWRFMGALGFGGKFRRDIFNHRWYVDCYSEDLTEDAQMMIADTNDALAELQEVHK